MTGTGGMLKNALVFGTAPALQKLAALVLLPYFTHYIREKEYGAIELIVFWTGLFVVLFGCEYRAGFLWRYAAAPAPADKRRIATSSTWFVAGAGLLAAATFALAGPPLLHAQLSSPPTPSLVAILAVGLAADVVGIVLFAILQAEVRAARMVALGLVQFTVDAVLKIVFVAHRGMGVEGFFLASTCASVVASILAAWSVRDLLAARISLREVRTESAAVLRYSSPLLWGAVAYLLVRKIDRPIVEETLSLAALGVYGRAARLTQLVLDFYVLPFQRSFDVWRLQMHARGEGLEQVARTYRWFMVGAGFVATGVATFGCDLFVGFAAAEYGGVREQVPLLNVAVLCQCAATVVASAFFVTQRTGTWTRIFVVALAVEAAAIALLARPLGIPGVAIALVLAHGFLWAVAAWWGRQLWPVPYRHGEALLMIVIASVLSIARIWLPSGPIWLALAIDTALVLGYLAIALPCARVKAADLSMVVARVRSILLRR